MIVTRTEASMLAPAKILRDKSAETDLAATQGLLEKVSRLVAFRYDLSETFDDLLLHLALHQEGATRSAVLLAFAQFLMQNEISGKTQALDESSVKILLNP